MLTQAKCEAFLIALISNSKDVAIANSLLKVFKKFLSEASSEFKEFHKKIIKIFPAADKQAEDDCNISKIYKGLGLPENPSSEQISSGQTTLKKLLNSFNKKLSNISWLHNQQIYYRTYLENLILTELGITEAKHLPADIKAQLKSYDELYQQLIRLPNTELVKDINIGKLLEKQGHIFNHVNQFVRVKSNLAADIKKIFADYRKKNGLVKFLKFANGNPLGITEYLLENLPSTYAKEDLIAHLGDRNFLNSVITDSISNLIMSKTIQYSEEELARLSNDINQFITMKYPPNETKQAAIVDFYRDNYLEIHDSKLKTVDKSDDDIREAVMNFAQNDELIAQKILICGGQEQNLRVKEELQKKAKINGDFCIIATTDDELHYSRDEHTGQIYWDIVQSAYTVTNGVDIFALNTKGQLEKIKANEAESIKTAIRQGLPAPRKPILQTNVRMCMCRENNEVTYKVVEFNVKVNTKDITYDYQPALRSIHLPQSQKTSKKFTYKKPQLLNLGQSITSYINRIIVENPIAAVRDFRRHNYISQEGFETANKLESEIPETIRAFAPNETIAQTMLACGGQVLQSYILTEINSRYLYHGHPIDLSNGIASNILYKKDKDKVIANIEFNLYIIKVGEKYFGFKDKQLAELSDTERSTISTNIGEGNFNGGLCAGYSPILSSSLELEFQEKDQAVACTIKKFTTQLELDSPTITLRSAKFSQDYERLRHEISRLSEKISALEQQKDSPERKYIQKLEARKNQLKAQQLQIDRLNFNNLYYYSDGQHDRAEKITQLGNLKAQRRAQKIEALKLKKLEAKDQLAFLEQQRRDILANMQDELQSQREELLNNLHNQIKSNFNAALALMKEPQTVLAKRLTKGFDNTFIKGLTSNVLNGNSKPLYNIQLSNKEDFLAFLTAINDRIKLIDGQLEINYSNKLERTLHSAIKAIDKNPAWLLGSQHDRIQYSKNLSAYSEQLKTLKQKLMKSEYYEYINKDCTIENGIYNDPVAKDLQKAIREKIIKHPKLVDIEKNIAVAKSKLTASMKAIEAAEKKHETKIKDYISSDTLQKTQPH